MTKKSIALIIVILLAIGVVTIGCGETCPNLDKSAPEFSLTELDGKTIALKDFRGKFVMLNFWQTTCSWCQYQMPIIQEALDKYQASGLIVLAVNVAESADKVKAYRETGKYTFTFLLDVDAKINSKYCIPGFPTTIFINKEGIIKDAKVGAFQTVNEIEEYLKSIN